MEKDAASVNLAHEKFPLPGKSESRIELQELEKLVDQQIRRYMELGCEVKGLGRGHIKRIKESVRRREE